MNKPKKALRGLFTRTENIEETEATPAAETVMPTEVTIVEDTITQPAELAPMGHDHHENIINAVCNVNLHFDNALEDRKAWGETQYVDVIKRIDIAQAEAFFLKGKLLTEVKDKFYVENKNGWKTFSEKTLGMNYTTVNQYIRVNKEFDVSSHRRRLDFGFEHYKALLPLSATVRTKLLEELPQVSVKELRTIVQHELTTTDIGTLASPKKHNQREVIDLLISIKNKVFDCTPDALTQEERWQLTAACRNVADELLLVAEQLSEFKKRSTQDYINEQPRTANTYVHTYMDEGL